MPRGIETLLFVCPKCGSRAPMVSVTNFSACPVVTACAISPPDFAGGICCVPDNVRDWNVWAKGRQNRGKCRDAGEEPIFQTAALNFFSPSPRAGRPESGPWKHVFTETWSGRRNTAAPFTGMFNPCGDRRFIGVSGDTIACADPYAARSKIPTACSYPRSCKGGV